MRADRRFRAASGHGLGNQPAEQIGGSRSLSLAASMSADLFRNDDRGYAVWLT
jgi:hypothetical protein